ncbi:MAG: sarcosine oxidase subunit delta [Pseudomonadota bacterium]
MIRIDCPFCGLRDHTEFSYEGDATIEYPALDASEDAWFDAVFLRENPRGWHREYWRHGFGCGLFLEVERHMVTHEIRSVKIAHPGMAKVVAEADE